MRKHAHRLGDRVSTEGVSCPTPTRGLGSALACPGPRALAAALRPRSRPTDRRRDRRHRTPRHRPGGRTSCDRGTRLHLDVAERTRVVAHLGGRVDPSADEGESAHHGTTDLESGRRLGCARLRQGLGLRPDRRRDVSRRSANRDRSRRRDGSWRPDTRAGSQPGRLGPSRESDRPTGVRRRVRYGRLPAVAAHHPDRSLGHEDPSVDPRAAPEQLGNRGRRVAHRCGRVPR